MPFELHIKIGGSQPSKLEQGNVEPASKLSWVLKQYTLEGIEEQLAWEARNRLRHTKAQPARRLHR